MPLFVTETPWIIRGLTWSTMGLEFAIPVLVLVFHLSCDYALHLFLFHWIMLVGWMAFLQPNDVAWLRQLFPKRHPAAALRGSSQLGH